MASKLTLAGQFANHVDVERFHTEAKSAAQLDHPGIVPIIEVGRLATEAASDVYSLGAILYEMLTSRPPFSADRPLEVVQAVINDEPTAPRVLNGRLPRAMEMILMKCLQKLTLVRSG